jgi:predicted phage terminase large subunit-like protein
VREEGSAHSLKAPKCRRTSLSHNPKIHARQRELKRVVGFLAEQWKPNAILVEDKASGQSLLQELKISTALPIITVKVDSDKQTRAQAVTPLMESGRVFIPESASWVRDFVEEMAAFPNGIHDDVVDSTTQH